MRVVKLLLILSTILEVYASDEVENLDSMSVEGVQYIQKQDFLKNAPMQKQITTKEALDIPGTNGDPLKAIKSFAGVVSSDNDSAEMIIHGSKPRETSFNINHLPIGYAFHLGGIHSVIAPEATKQLDAYLGAFDVSYYGMGAVIDITPNYPTGTNRGRVHIGMYDSDFAIDAKITDNISLFIGARRSYFDLIAAKLMDAMYTDPDQKEKQITFSLFPQFYDANMMLVANYGNSMISLEYIMSHDEMKLNSTMGGDSDPIANGKINIKQGFNTLGSRWVYYGDNFTSMTLVSRLDWEDDLELFNDDFYANIHTLQYDLFHETVFDISNHKPKIGFHYIQNETPVDLHITKEPTAEDNTYGYSGWEVVDLKTTFDAKFYIGFIQDTWSLSDKLNFRYGVRAWKSDYQNFNTGVDPRGAIVYSIDDDISISFAGGKYSQMPEETRVIEGFGNDEIDTFEHAIHYSFAYNQIFSDNSSINIEPYYKDMQNLAIADNTKAYLAVGKGNAYGLDMTYQKKSKDVNIIVAYTYMQANRQMNTSDDTLHRFYGEIPHTLQVSSNYKFKSGWFGGWKIAGLIKYSNGKLYTPIVKGADGKNYIKLPSATDSSVTYKQPNYGTTFSKRMPDIYDLDLKISKTVEYVKGRTHEYAIELMNFSTLFHANVTGIRYNDEYENVGYYYQSGFVPAFHYTYRF